VHAVQPGLPAVGVLQPGDVVLALGGAPTPTVGDFSKALASHAPGETIRVRYARGGAVTEAAVTLAERRDLRVLPLRPAPPSAQSLLRAVGSGGPPSVSATP
jgi:PDZ domain-containing protein